MKSKTKGFTLIELLFVIAIISVIAAAGMSIVKQRAQEAKVEKCALQMQQMLQAGMAYYVDNNCWPHEAKCASGAPDFATHYIPVGTTINPWGEQLNYQYTATPGSRFQVTTKAPNNSIAQRVAGMLPNAEVDKTDVTKIITETTIPGQVTGETNVYVAKVGLTSGGAVTGFSCPTGYKSAIYFSPHSLQNARGVVAPKDKDKDSHSSYYLDKLPSFTVSGGCDGTNSCSSYSVTINEGNTGVHCTEKIDFWGQTVYYHCNNDVNFYSSYVSNYTIYCCKITDAGTKASNYCN